MHIDIITIFPEFFTSPLDCSIVARAQQSGVVDVVIHNLRDYTNDKHQVVDDYPYGGGAGMVMKPEPLVRAVDNLLSQAPADTPVVLLTPQGQRLDQAKAQEMSGQQHLILICGHYEGIDERVRQTVVTEELSIGDYVLTGGEPAALVIIDAVIRLLPGALGNPGSVHSESFADGLLEHPQYTRPAEWRGMKIPDILLSGHHENIRRWRRKQTLRRTLERRPDLLKSAKLTEEDNKLLTEIKEAAQPEVVAGQENTDE